MAQIIVRGIDDEALSLLSRRAERLGWSREQLVRSILEREAAAEAGWTKFEAGAKRIRERLKRQGGVYGDSSGDIRSDRER